MKCKRNHQGFELWSVCPFATAVTTKPRAPHRHTHRHTHTHIYIMCIYIYIYICMCMCVCVYDALVV